MKIVGIIQARTGSTRFPNKINKKIFGKTLLELYIDRVKTSKKLKNIVLATTTEKKDAKLKKITDKTKIEFFQGNEHDLIDRYYQCAKEFKADIIVRLTSDDAFVDPDIIDTAIDKMLKIPSLDFVTNHFTPTYPEGLDIEVYKFSTLETLWKKAELSSDREHVFTYIFHHPSQFKILHFNQSKNYSYLRWTIDYECDYQMVKTVYKYLYKKNPIFKQMDIIKLLESHPEIMKINNNIKRKEGVNKSIKEDGGKLL